MKRFYATLTDWTKEIRTNLYAMLLKNKIKPAYNTDNKGKLFVTLFALLLHLRQIRNSLYRDRASARHQLCNRE